MMADVKTLDRREFLLAASGLAVGANMQNRPVRRSLGEAGSYELEPAAAGKSLKAPDGRVVLTYLTSKPEGLNLRANSACCFHPVVTPSGERLTDLAPGDHVHHRGIFLAWHSIDFRRKADFSKMGPTRPTHGFLTPESWRRALSAAGFERVEILPDVEALAKHYDAFFVAAVIARKPSG